MHKILTILFLFCFIAVRAQEPIAMDDKIYTNKIATVLLYPAISDLEDPKRLLSPPIISLQTQNPLVLEFDDLSGQSSSFRAKIFHCNSDWTKSILNEIEYTYEYNDYIINDREQSFSTKVPYYHYRLAVPRLKLSGNYVLVVYENRTPVCSRRFMVYDNKVNVTAKARFSQGITQQQTDQQIDFSIDYGGLNLNAPQTDLKVVMRKNFRWDQSKTGFKPSNVRPFDKLLEYNFFNLENTFQGGNEFRYFDSRTLAARGYGIESLERVDVTRLILFPDKSRTNGHLQLDDFNGGYIVDQSESGRGSIEADYTPVLFSLKTEEDPELTYYVNGGFNLWQLNDRNRMKFNTDTGMYEAEILLKQGVVNFDYTAVDSRTKKADESLIEGNYATTENDYDILVYFRPPAGRSDLLVGYRTVEWNRRR